MLNLVKAGCGKSARPVWEADGGQRRKVRLLRPDSEEIPENGTEQGGAVVLMRSKQTENRVMACKG